MPKSDFQTWFKKQHGPRPGGLVGDDALAERAELGERASALLRAREMWDERYTSALYAWQAREVTYNAALQVGPSLRDSGARTLPGSAGCASPLEPTKEN